MNININKDRTFTVEIEGKVIGYGSIIGNGMTYVEALEIKEEYRNQRYGTMALNELVKIYGEICIAPDNEKAKRLYEKIADPMKETYYDKFGFAIDQGYGVYVI